MQIIVLYEETEQKTAAKLLGLIQDYHVQVKALAVSDWISLDSEAADCFHAYSRFIVPFSSPEIFRSSWFSFFAGYSLGRHRSLIVYGNKRWIPQIAAKLIVPIQDEADLRAYLSHAVNEWISEEVRQNARKTLCGLGIPFVEAGLIKAVNEKNIEALELFLQAGFSADSRNTSGVPLLCLATRAGDRGMVNALLKAGSSVNAQAGDRGTSALIDSALGRHKDIMADLIAAGADVNMKSKDGQSALIISVSRNDESCIEMLLKAGANPDEPDALGASARKYAVLFNKPDVVALFNTYARGRERERKK